jgi:hypothetical protein
MLLHSRTFKTRGNICNYARGSIEDDAGLRYQANLQVDTGETHSVQVGWNDNFPTVAFRYLSWLVQGAKPPSESTATIMNAGIGYTARIGRAHPFPAK